MRLIQPAAGFRPKPPAPASARGIRARCPTCSNPRRRSVAVVSASSRRHCTGNPAIASACPPGGTTGSAPCRATACAAPGVSAIAARAVIPSCASRFTRCASMARSPSQKCVQPATSSHSPSAPSAAASGVMRWHQRASRSSEAASSAGSASITASPGTTAMACATAIPARNPSFAAAWSAAAMTRRLPSCTAVTNACSSGGADPARPPDPVGRPMGQPDRDDPSHRTPP